MREVINFFSKFWFFIFFLFLESISFYLYISNIKNNNFNIYNKYIYDIIGNVYKIKNNIETYLSLESENNKLLKENAMLHYNVKTSKITINRRDFTKLDEFNLQNYIFTPAKVINNNISQQENFITINKGELDGIKIDMGVILPNGIAGIIVKTSPHFSTAISILNTQIRINSRIKKNKYFGTTTWDGKDYRIVLLKDIPKHISINIGDIVETDTKSTIFPEGIIIGKIISFKLNEEDGTYRIRVKLSADIYSMENVYIVKNLLKKELKEVEKIK